jgi:integrase
VAPLYGAEQFEGNLSVNSRKSRRARTPAGIVGAADSGLLSPELAAGISRVKGVKQLGFRSGNWLSVEQSSEVLKHACGDSIRAKRDYAMLAMLFGCGFRRSELVRLELNEVQMRQGHWAVVDLIGKGGHIRTVPIPEWVKAALSSRQNGKGVGQRHLAECCVVRSQDLLRESGIGAYCTA